MTKNWALVIGINQYEFLQPLKFANRDAQLMQEFLCNEADFDQVYLFCDHSLKGLETSNHPSRNNLLQFLQNLFEKSCLQPGDNFWFFFSGHGLVHANQDYIMPCDGNLQDVENTAIPVNYLTECLRSCGAGNVILVFDACRHQNKTFGEKFGRQTQQIARQNGFTSIFSCSSDECSYEIETLKQGVFTYALVEGLGNQGQCATIERLHQYLSFRVPQLVNQYKHARQTPQIVAEPNAKLHRIVLPKHATLNDISQLKISAFQAEVDNNLELAEQLWMQANTIASTPDLDAIAAMQRIAQLRSEFLYSQTNIVLQPSYLENNGRSSLPLQTLEVTGTSTCEHEVNKTTEYFLKLNNISVFKPEFKNDKINNKNTIKDKEINLCSALEINYQQLKDLLAAGKWKQADRETLSLLLKAAGREEQGWLNIQSINQLPCVDLYTIDQLWLKYSNGRFGLSVQKSIWESVGAQTEIDYEIWGKFCERVGWRVNDNWLFYSDLTFSSDAPEGHFPAAGVIHLLTEWRGWVVGSLSCVIGFSALTERMGYKPRPSRASQFLAMARAQRLKY